MGTWPAHGSTDWDDPVKVYVDDLVATKRPIGVDIPMADLSATGTPTIDTFLRGDGVWAVPPGGTATPGGDTVPPSVPANVRTLEVRSTSARVGWDAATDNVAVTGYEVSVNGAVQAGPVVTLYAELSGLTPTQSYSVTVRARDAAGNWSALSAPLIVTALAAASTGYPDASNSPYKDGSGVLHYFPDYPTDATEVTQTLTETAGLIYTTSDNQIIEGLYLNGGAIIVRHQGVTIRRCYLKCTTTYWNAVIPQSGATLSATTNYNTTVEDCCVDGNDTPGGAGLMGVGLTVRRCNIFRCDNGGQGEDAQTWEDNFFHDMMTFLAESHTDLIQFDGTVDWPVRNWTLRHNTMLSRTVDNQGTTSCVITNQDPTSGLMANILMEDNIFAGGAFSVYGPNRLMNDFHLYNNKFWTLYYPTVGAYGESGNDVALMDTLGNSVGAFAGGLVNNVITGSWVHDHYLGSPSGTSDTTAPSVPGSLAAVDITTTGFTVSWTASTDNIGVTGYEVYLDGTSVGVVSVTSKTFTALTAGTSYSVTVRARDAAGNWSAQSTALPVSTQAASNFIIKSVSISSSLPSNGTQTVTTGEDVATAVGDFVLVYQFSDYRNKANTALPVANGTITLNEIGYPGVDNANKFRASWYYATAAGAQTITAVTSSPNDDDKRLVAIVIHGVAASSPVDIFNSVDAASSTAGGGGENFYSSPSVTTTGPARLLLSTVSVSSGRTYASAETGFTLLKTETAVGGFISYSIVRGLQASAGATGTIDHLYTTSGTNVTSMTLALKPA